MTSRLARLLGLAPEPSADEPWDDHGVEDVAAIVARRAKAGDDNGPAASASRAAVLGAFANATISTTPSGALPSARSLASAAAVHRRRGRRAGLVLVAASVLVVTGATAVAASSPGWPLYPARVAAEGLFLPSDPTARAEAQLSRMDQRVVEAERATSSGDAGAVEAALLAYARIADEAAEGPLPAAAADAGLGLRVRAQLSTIARIDAGDAALADAAARVQAAAGDLLAALGQFGGDGSPGPGPGNGPATPSSSSSGPPTAPAQSTGPSQQRGSGGPSATGQPAGTQQPGASRGPGASSGPTRTPGPSPSAAPMRTPAASPHGPTGSGDGGQGAGAGDATPSSGQGGSGGGSASPGPSSAGGSASGNDPGASSGRGR